MIKVFTSKTQKLGEIGEKLAERFLVKQGFRVIVRNYTRQGGEVDIIAYKSRRLHFCEVKTISCSLSKSVSGETYNPLQNIAAAKLKKLLNTVELYIMENGQFHETSWQLDGLAVYYDAESSQAKVDWVENINL